MIKSKGKFSFNSVLKSTSLLRKRNINFKNNMPQRTCTRGICCQFILNNKTDGFAKYPFRDKYISDWKFLNRAKKSLLPVSKIHLKDRLRPTT